ncbi:MAG: translation elongation factor Ts [Planctomycetes bacterium]|nr:translation elongation factor Ts [Planctomycetota bacterium]
MAISAKDVMSLRQRTGMGMMECKAALTEADGDVTAAIEILRAAAKGKMDERSDRAAAEGAIAIATDTGAAAMVELNSETDFTARNDSFVGAADKVAQIALAGADGAVATNDAIVAAVDEVRLTTKENCSFARGIKYTAQKIGAYLHHNRKVAALVVVEGDVDAETLTGLAQHVAAADGQMLPIPLAIDESGLPAADVAAKKAEFIEEAKASGKPADIAEKMSGGKLRKWVDENTLVGQAFVKDMTGKTKVAEVLGKAKVKAFTRYQVGVK